MAVKIRLMRVGKKKQPTYRVVVADARSPRDGRFIEILGQYAPRQEPSVVTIDNDRALHWLNKGAQPTEQVAKLLEIAGVWDAVQGETRQGRCRGQGEAKAKTAKARRQARSRREAAKRRPPKRPQRSAAPKSRAADEPAAEAPAGSAGGSGRSRSRRRRRRATSDDDDFEDDDEFEDDDDFEDESRSRGQPRRRRPRQGRRRAHRPPSRRRPRRRSSSTRASARGDVTLLVHASPGDMGRIIGKRGRVIQAMRQVARAAGSHRRRARHGRRRGVTAHAVHRLEVGRIGRAHGLRGEVVVTPITESPRAVRCPARCSDRRANARCVDRDVAAAPGPLARALRGRRRPQRGRGAAGQIVVTRDPLGDAARGRDLGARARSAREVRDRAGDALGTRRSRSRRTRRTTCSCSTAACSSRSCSSSSTATGCVVVDLPEGLLDL